MDRNKYADPETFVKAWQASESLAEVVKRIGGTRHSVAMRASRYRRDGVKLKKFRTVSGRLDVKALNKLCV